MLTGASRRGRGMLVGGLVGGNLAGLVVLAASLGIGGKPGGLAALIGFGTVVLFFSIGQAIELIALELPTYTGLSLAMASYAVRVIGIGVMLGLVLGAAGDQIDPIWLAVAVVSTVVGWIAGLILVASRQRVPVFDADYQPPTGWEDGQ